jgi:hypothetical protein
MLGALVAFETFTTAMTEFVSGGSSETCVLRVALGDDPGVGLLPWTSPAARLLTPGRPGQAIDAWYVLAAWFVAAAMNAVLTWWAVSVALVGHDALAMPSLGGTLIRVVPVFVAILSG